MEPRQQQLIGYIPDLIYAPELDHLNDIGRGLHAHVRSSGINAQHRFSPAGRRRGVLPCFVGDAEKSLVNVLPTVAITCSLLLAIHLNRRPNRM